MMLRVVILAFALLLVVAAVAAQAPSPSADRVREGNRVFFEVGCHGCHTVGALGTPIGPDLSRVGAKYPRPYLERWLRDPSAQRPSAHMPKLELTEPQISALAAFLSTLR